MPLPPAPAKRATLLRVDAASSPARGASNRKSPPRSADVAAQGKRQALELSPHTDMDLPDLESERSAPVARAELARDVLP